MSKKIICANCGEREGTINWVGRGGVMDFVHGMYEVWCELCAVEADLEYAKKQAKRVPELEKKLEKLKIKDN